MLTSTLQSPSVWLSLLFVNQQVCLNSPGAGLYKVYEKVAELASEEGMDEKTDDETKTETEDTTEEKKVIEERMVKSVSPESSVWAVIG